MSSQYNGINAVCGIGSPSGRRKSAVTANQSASPPTSPASAIARIHPPHHVARNGYEATASAAATHNAISARRRLEPRRGASPPLRRTELASLALVLPPPRSRMRGQSPRKERRLNGGLQASACGFV